MTLPRSQLINIQSTPYYHCISRCVRRAFLCGDDHYSGKNFDHRKPWLLERLNLLEKVFSIQIAAYAVMSNHYHLVLHVNSDQIKHWSRDDIISRWRMLYQGPPLVKRYIQGELLTDIEEKEIENIVSIWKSRLQSISWFMRNLNEFVARMANQEDNCKGRFWEGRFKSQALMDETALLSCMAYVDLNPIRSGQAVDLQSSDYTSIQYRLHRINNKGKAAKMKPMLMAFSESISESHPNFMIPFSFRQYIELVDWSGRAVRSDKIGYISDTPKALETMAITPEQWKMLSLDIQKETNCMLHGLERLAKIEKRQNLKKSA